MALRYSVRLSGVTQLALTKLDVLSGFERVRICEAYRTREGERITDFPYHQTVFHGCRPEYRDDARAGTRTSRSAARSTSCRRGRATTSS